jgi:Met-10+ like-protein
MSFTSEAAQIPRQSMYAQARGLYWNVICALLWFKAGHRIWAGPFVGTRYRVGAVCSASVPKLLGTYERELQPEIEKLANERWSAVIDVGAAEGYYAVGFARRLRDVPVVAYEMDPHGRALLRANAEENSVVESIDLREECTAAAFAPC